MNLDELDELCGDHPTDDKYSDRVVRAPFSFHGSKTRSLAHIIPRLPVLNVFVDVFGGSGVVTLNRQPSKKLDVYNDRWSGVTTFFRCVRDPVKRERMVEQLSLMPHSKEDFYDCKQSWEKQTDDVDRAVRWYYLITTSYGSVGRNWGYGIASSFGHKFKSNIKLFPEISERFLDVQVENDDFRVMLDRYDSLSTVFYCDPPYLDSHQPGSYIHKMTHNDHVDMLERIHDMQGFVAVSSYRNTLYDSYAWDDVFEWTIQGSNHGGQTETNHRVGAKISTVRKECLYIKEVG